MTTGAISHWLIFIVTEWTDIWIYNLWDVLACNAGVKYFGHASVHFRIGQPSWIWHLWRIGVKKIILPREEWGGKKCPTPTPHPASAPNLYWLCIQLQSKMAASNSWFIQHSAHEREQTVWQFGLLAKKNWCQFSCVCPVIGNEFHYNIVKIVCGPTWLSPHGSTATFTMLWRNSWSITGQTHKKLNVSLLSRQEGRAASWKEATELYERHEISSWSLSCSHIPINLRIADWVEAPAAWAVLSIVAMQLKKDQIQMEELKQGLQNIGLKVYLLKKKTCHWTLN